MKRCSVRRVLDSRVDISRHTNEKQDSLHVYILYRQVKEVSALGVELEIKANTTDLRRNPVGNRAISALSRQKPCTRINTGILHSFLHFLKAKSIITVAKGEFINTTQA